MAKVKVKNVLFNILIIVAVAAVAFVSFNLLSGIKGYSVVSNSMADTLKRGDVVFSERVSFDEIEVGDIVTVRVNDDGFFTHRVVEIDRNKGEIVTKGDANTSEDPMPTRAENVVGKMKYSIPLCGYLAIWFGKLGINGLIYFALAAVLLMTLNLILNKIKSMRGGKNEQN